MPHGGGLDLVLRPQLDRSVHFDAGDVGAQFLLFVEIGDVFKNFLDGLANGHAGFDGWHGILLWVGNEGGRIKSMKGSVLPKL